MHRDKGGRLCVLHRNILLPCPFLPTKSKSPVRKRHQKQPPRAYSLVNMPQTLNVQPSADSDEEDYLTPTPNQLNAIAPCFSPQPSTFSSDSPPDDAQDIPSEKMDLHFILKKFKDHLRNRHPCLSQSQYVSYQTHCL